MEFDDTQVAKRLFDWDSHELKTLGPVEASRFVELSWWPIIGNQLPATSADGDSPIEWCDSLADRNLVVESQFGVKSLDSQKCRVVELRLLLNFELYQTQATELRLNDSPRIAAAWPKPGVAPPIKVRRSINNGASLEITYAGVTPALSESKEYEEQFERFIPVGFSFVGPKRVPRTATFAIRATSTFPEIEGMHYCGVLISQADASYLRVSATIQAAVQTPTIFGGWSKPRKLKEEVFTVKDFFPIQ